MCFIALAWRCRPDYPMILAANRDEAYDRPAEPPGLISKTPRIVAGRDLREGGTWLGVNARGLVAAITNRAGEPVDRTRPSRGLLVLSALKQPDAEALRGWLEKRLAAKRENPFNLLYADRVRGFVTCAPAGAAPESVPLSPGLHLLTDRHPLDGLSLPAADAIDLSAPIDDVLGRFAALLGTGEAPAGGYAPAKDRGAFGTVSASVIALSRDFPRGCRYLHAEGNPITTAFKDRAELIAVSF